MLSGGASERGLNADLAAAVVDGLKSAATGRVRRCSPSAPVAALAVVEEAVPEEGRQARLEGLRSAWRWLRRRSLRRAARPVSKGCAALGGG